MSRLVRRTFYLWSGRNWKLSFDMTGTPSVLHDRLLTAYKLKRKINIGIEADVTVLHIENEYDPPLGD